MDTTVASNQRTPTQAGARAMIRHRGFTLLEVLVALAIVVLLSTITYAVLGSAKGRALENTCAGHFRSLYLAAEIYRSGEGGSGLAGDLYSMGFPPDVVQLPSRRPYIGEWVEWTCPAPKRQSFDYWPHYTYELLAGQSKGTLASAIQEYGGAVPIFSDKNHNNHSTVNIYAPRVSKRLLYIDLNGAFHAKIVHHSLLSTGDFGMFELK